MVPSAAGAVPQGHGGVAQRAPAGHGGPGGADAQPCLRQRVGVLGQRPASSVQCPVSGVRCPVSGVRCGRPASRVPVHAAGVRCPAWVSGVRGFPRPVSGRQVVEGGAGARSRRMAGSAWWPAVSTASSSAARVGTWRSRLAQAVLGQRRGRLGLGRRSWEVVGQWLGRPRGRPGLAGWARGSPVGGEPGCAARWRLRSVVIVRGLGPGRLVAASLLGWTVTCARGRGAAAACGERRRLDAGDALTCSVGGGGEGI
jgi:hypothetical protein